MVNHVFSKDQVTRGGVVEKDGIPVLVEQLVEGVHASVSETTT